MVEFIRIVKVILKSEYINHINYKTDWKFLLKTLKKVYDREEFTKSEKENKNLQKVIKYGIFYNHQKFSNNDLDVNKSFVIDGLKFFPKYCH